MALLKNSIKIGSWNIGGAKNVSNDPDFTELIKDFDIIVLLETFASDDSLHVPGFKCKNVFRKTKHKRAKRNSGGVSVLTKNEITKFVTPVRVTAEHFIWINISSQLTGYNSDVYCCCAYIPPYGSSYYKNNGDINLFDELCQDIARYSRCGYVMVTGDLNARVGNKSDIVTLDEINDNDDNPLEPNFITAPPRCCQDSVVNTWGNTLLDLCFACNLCLLNGRSLGDTAGRYTYYAGSGHSTIDVTLVDKDMLKNTLNFTVHDLNEFSHHCIIETIIRCRPINLTPQPERELHLEFDKYSWDSDSSALKLFDAINSNEAKALFSKITNNKYEQNISGTDSFTTDLNKYIKMLHDRSCKKIKIRKKRKSKFAKVKRQTWFTQECQKQRERLRRAANFLSRHPHNRTAQDEYRSTLKTYRKIIKKAKKLHRENAWDTLNKSVDKRQLWSVVADLRGSKQECPLSLQELEAHFGDVLNCSTNSIPVSKIKTFEKDIAKFMAEDNPDIISGGYTPNMVKKMARTLKNGKSGFLDGVINEVLKHAMPHCAEIFSKFFNHIELSAVYPSDWKTSFLVPLYKKGGRGDPDNYRGLAVGSNVSKFYSKCLNLKLKTYCETHNLISPQQFGFRDDYRTHDAIFSLRSMVNFYKHNKKPVYAIFVDFSKAFDSIDRTALIYKLGQIGIRGNLLKLISSMYDKSDYIIKSNSKFSYPIESSSGVKQGCCLSPLLFNTYVNDIHSIFNPDCDPINFENIQLNSLSYADDLVLLSESPQGMKNCLKALENYCSKWGLNVNPKKTKVIVFNRSFSKEVKNLLFSIHGNIIETVKSYTYLGVVVTNTGQFYKATEALYLKSLRALFSLYSAIDVRADKGNIQLYLKLFDSLIKPISLYGCEIWGYHISQTPNNPISKFINKFYRTLLGVPKYASTLGVHVELGRFPIDVNTNLAMIKYWFRLICLPENKLVSRCYWNSLKSIGESDPWFSAIKNIIFSCGQYELWSSHSEMSNLYLNNIAKSSCDYIKRNLKDQFLLNAVLKMDQEVKLEPFKKLKIHTNAYTVSPYLTKINSFLKRSLLAKLRLGILPLESETGRRFGVPRSERICKQCDSGEIEDLEHFLFVCPKFAIPRLTYLVHLSKISPFVQSYSNKEKLTFLFFNDTASSRTIEFAANFLFTLCKSRDILPFKSS